MVSGGAPSGRQQGMLSRVPRRAFTMRPDRFSGEDGVEMAESELVPSLLTPIILILGAANDRVPWYVPPSSTLCVCLCVAPRAHQMLLIPCLCLTRSFHASRGCHVTRHAVIHYVYTSSWNKSVSPGCRLPTHQHHRVLCFLSS
jgi:hypothetical protein